MRKLTVIAALLGSVYFANAQVGIGTPDPALSAELDIVSKTKGILIPRVNLTDLAVYGPIVGDPTQSLLVYNLTNDADATKDLVVGFYYWENAKWNRVVSKAELDEVVKNIGGDITNVINRVENLEEIINFILPSNPDNETDVDDRPSHTTIVYNYQKNTFEEVTYDQTTKTYITNEINLGDIISGYETITVMLPVEDANGKVTGYKYYNEGAISDFITANPGSTHKDITTDAPGGFLVDVKGDVVNNIKEILESTTTIVVDGITFNTVEEYLQYITQFSKGNVIYKQLIEGDDDSWAFQYWDPNKGNGGEYVTINLQEIVDGLETKTQIKRSEVLTDATLPAFAETVTAPVEADVKKGEIFYAYYNEDKTRVDYINMTGDILSSITNNTDVRNAITNVLNQGGNVYFGDHDNDASTPDVLFKVEANGDKTAIDITSTVIEVINQNIDNIKNILGDKVTKNTYTNTGDTINGYSVFKVMAETEVKRADGAAGASASTTGITLPSLSTGQSIKGFASFTILDANNKVVTNNVTDVTANGFNVSFNLGTGNHYTSLPAGVYSVIVEVLIEQALVPITPQP